MGFINNVNVDVRGAAHIAPCTYKTVVLKQNITKQNLNVLTQNMLDEYGKNTKFVIKWDYVLDGDITVPENCVLQFDGGSFEGHILLSENCKVYDGYLHNGSRNVINTIGDNIEIVNCVIDGEKEFDVDHICIHVNSGNSHVKIHNCTLKGAGSGIYVDVNCSDINVNGCSFYDMQYNVSESSIYGYGIVFNHSETSKGVIGATITNNYFDKSVYRHSLYIQSSENIIISENRFIRDIDEDRITGEEDHMMFRGNNNILISNNIFIGGAKLLHAVTDEQNLSPTNYSLIGNHIEHIIKAPAARFDNAKNIIVSDNLFIDCLECLRIYESQSAGDIVLKGNVSKITSNDYYGEFAIISTIANVNINIQNNVLYGYRSGGNGIIQIAALSSCDSLIIKDNMISSGGCAALRLSNAIVTSYTRIEGNCCRNKIIMDADTLASLSRILFYINNNSSEHPTLTATTRHIVENNTVN